MFASGEYKNDFKKAENYYKKSISINDKLPEPYNNLGSLYNSLLRYDDAVYFYKESIKKNKEFSQAHYNLGLVYITLGNFIEAKNHLKEAIKLNPNLAHAHRSLSRITKYTTKNDHFIKLKKLYENTNINEEDTKMNLAFAFGKACEDLKNFEKSFFLYKEANFINRRKIEFSIEKEKEKFKDIQNTFNKELFDKYKNDGCSDGSPIFIVGMPRSGTTLVEQILSSHPDVYGADEVDFIPNLIKKNFRDHNLSLFFKGIVEFDKENFNKIGKEYILMMKDISHNSKRTTDKLPINFLSIGFIKIILPKSKIIHCCRNPKDNIFSIFKNHFPGGRVSFAYNLEEIIEYYNLYFNLMEYWNHSLPNFILNIKYEKLILDKEKEIKNLLKFCNLDWTSDCLNFHKNKRPIKTASDTQARSKIYNTSIDSWKNYEKFLKDYFVKLKN